jgi:hypothetical protein
MVRLCLVYCEGQDGIHDFLQIPAIFLEYGGEYFHGHCRPAHDDARNNLLVHGSFCVGFCRVHHHHFSHLLDAERRICDNISVPLAIVDDRKRGNLHVCCCGVNRLLKLLRRVWEMPGVAFPLQHSDNLRVGKEGVHRTVGVHRVHVRVHFVDSWLASKTVSHSKSSDSCGFYVLLVDNKEYYWTRQTPWELRCDRKCSVGDFQHGLSHEEEIRALCLKHVGKWQHALAFIRQVCKRCVINAGLGAHKQRVEHSVIKRVHILEILVIRTALYTIV